MAESVVTSKRIFVGGLSAGVTAEEVAGRFSHFGKVSNVSVKTRKDDTGATVKSFAHLDLQGDEASIKKCFNTYQNAKWKGSVLQLQFAKESFLERLQKEREECVSSVKSEQHKPRADEAVTPADILNAAKGVPGTLVPGKKDWVVGKYGRALPVMKLKKSYKIPIIKHDPSKFCHAAKVFKDERTQLNGEMPCDKLTWEIDQPDSEITRKRKGEFPENASSPRKKINKENAQTVAETSESKPVYRSDHSGASRRGMMLRLVNQDADSIEIVKSGQPVARAKAAQASRHISNKFDSDVDDSDAESVPHRPTTSRESVSFSNKGAGVVNGHKGVPEFRGLSMLSDYTESPGPSSSKTSSLPSLAKDVDRQNTNHKSKAADRQSDNHITHSSSNSPTQSESLCQTAHPVKDDKKKGSPRKTQAALDVSLSPGPKSLKAEQAPDPRRSVPEFKGLAMLTDYHLNEQENSSPQSSSLANGITDSKTERLGSLVSASSAGLLKHGKNASSKKHELEVNKVKKKTMQSSSGNGPEVPSDDEQSDSSAGTDEILLKHKNAKKTSASTPGAAPLKPNTSVSGGNVQEKLKRLASDRPEAPATGDGGFHTSELASGSTEAVDSGESHDSDLDSNDFALVARKLMQQVKQASKSVRAEATTGKKDGLKKMKKKSDDVAVHSDLPAADKKAGGDGSKSLTDLQSKLLGIAGSEDKKEAQQLKKEKEEKNEKSLSEKEKRKLANEKRLRAMKEQAKHREQQQQLMKEALKNVDGPKDNSQRIVFESSDDEGESRSQAVTLNTSSTPGVKVDSPASVKPGVVGPAKAGRNLFDGSSEDESEDENYDEMFKSKPQFEGKGGEKLLKLEKSFGDDRFKLDAKFADTDEDDSSESEDDNVNADAEKDIAASLKDEKSASLKILEDIVGKSSLDRFTEKINRNTKKIVDMNTLRFDPTKMQLPQSEYVSRGEEKQAKAKLNAQKNKASEKEASSKVQVEEDDPVNVQKLKTEKSQMEKTVSDKEQNKKEDRKKQPQRAELNPQAKQSKVEVSSSLVNLFKTSEGDGSFSLLRQFGGEDVEDSQSQEADDASRSHFEEKNLPSNGLVRSVKDKKLETSSAGQDALESTKAESSSEEDEEEMAERERSVGRDEGDKELNMSDDDDDDDDEEEAVKQKPTLESKMSNEDGVDADMINAGRVDIRFTKDAWLDQWETLRQTMRKLFKTKHKDALKKKRLHGEAKRKQEFLRNARKGGKKHSGFSKKR